MTEIQLDELNLQEAERKRIAEDLHDTTVQELVALSQQLELVNLYFDKDEVQARLELATARKQIKSIIDGIRETIYNLRPMAFDDIGWDAAIERIRQEADSCGDMQVVFRVDSFPEIEYIYQITLYRILREAVKNVCHHAKASLLTVDLHKKGKTLVLEVADNGVGMNGQAQDNHFGMQFMKEKAALLNGEMEIASNQHGTKITVTIPYLK